MPHIRIVSTVPDISEVAILVRYFEIPKPDSVDNFVSGRKLMIKNRTED